MASATPGVKNSHETGVVSATVRWRVVGKREGGGVRATMLRKIRSLILNDACRMRYSGTARQVHF